MWSSRQTNSFTRALSLLFLTAAACVTGFVFPEPAVAQNLCPNPGFEQIGGCPAGQGEIDLAAPWDAPGVPAELFHTCHANGLVPGCTDVSVPENFAGHAPAHNGSGYGGFWAKGFGANERSYMSAPLSSSLLTGQLYEVRAWFRRSSFSEYAVNRQGIVLSTAALMQPGNQPIAVVPQVESSIVMPDTGAWVLLSDFYVAAGGEAHITIGNFRNDAATSAFGFTTPTITCATMNGAAYYYVDDVSVSPVTEIISISGDTIICTGETATLTGQTNTTGWWSLLTTASDTLTVNASLVITPATTTTYIWHGIILADTVTVQVVAPPQVALPPDTILCSGETILLDATTPGCTYEWSTGATAAQITVGDPGSYVITVDNGGCSVRDTFFLDVLVNPIPYLGADSVICPDQNEILILDAGPGVSYLWMPVNDTTQTLVVSQSGNYSVAVTHADGCETFAALNVTESCPELVFIPGAFTPNNDGKNDTFFMQSSNIYNFSIGIYNRWGQLIFSSTDPLFIWDGTYEGKNAPGGNYTYQVTYDAPKPSGGTRKEVREGSVILIR